MAQMYYKLITKADWTIDQVPDKYKEEVQALLDADSNE
ncbi:CD1375 family protein [Eubacteriaceae bacterium ES2]|nr:CD1375 family protein [Eubacteriaceae bacterium ES2]